ACWIAEHRPYAVPHRLAWRSVDMRLFGLGKPLPREESIHQAQTSGENTWPLLAPVCGERTDNRPQHRPHIRAGRKPAKRSRAVCRRNSIADVGLKNTGRAAA